MTPELELEKLSVEPFVETFSIFNVVEKLIEHRIDISNLVWFSWRKHSFG